MRKGRKREKYRGFVFPLRWLFVIVKSGAVQNWTVLWWYTMAFSAQHLPRRALCAALCRPSAGLPKTQLFNEHIDQCFSHLHFPHRESLRERDREGGEEKDREKKNDEETKALEKL